MKGLPGLHERTIESVKGLPVLKKHNLVCEITTWSVKGLPSL